jgi:ADP-ribose pyrophosphatase YjhB (NUDIX family)
LVKDPQHESVRSTYPDRIFRFCPRCGSDGLCARGDKPFVCSGCGFEYYINAAAAVVALIEDPEKRLLLTLRAREPKIGTLDLPGGFVDIHETAEHALVREVREELNLETAGLSYFGSFPNTYPYGGITYFTLDLAFICTVSDLSTIRAGDDAESYIFVPLQEIRLNEIGLDSIRKIVSAYADSRSKK